MATDTFAELLAATKDYIQARDEHYDSYKETQKKHERFINAKTRFETAYQQHTGLRVTAVQKDGD